MSEPRTYDVVIVGGSVAGAATALHLAGRGRSVALLDRARFPRDKPCGEGLMPNGVAALAELGLLERVLPQARVLTGVRYQLPDGPSAYAPFTHRPDGFAFALGVRRETLDHVLHLAAQAEPRIDVRDGFHVREVGRSAAGGVWASDGAERVGGRVLVGADGLGSRVRAQLGWTAKRRFVFRYGVTGHFALPRGRCLEPTIEVLLLDGGAEAYLTPLAEGRALLAFLGGKRFMRSLAGDLREGYRRAVAAEPYLRNLFAGAELTERVQATGPFAVRSRRVAGRGALLVGDAAGFVDPITGEGMASALEQARAAAAVIDRALDSTEPLPDLAAFAAERRRLVRSTELLTWIALGLSRSQRLSRRAVAALNSRPELFAKLLAVNSRSAGLGAVSPREWLALATGL